MNRSDILFENDVYRMRSCRDGVFLYNPKDTFIGRSLDRYGEWCHDEMHCLEPFLGPDKVVVDAGANIGTHTIFFAKRSQVVFAYEPQRLSYQLLVANISLNGLCNVHTKQAALGAKLGNLKVPLLDLTAEQNFGSLRLGEEDEGESVLVLPIDSLGLHACDVIKVDVEGMEKEVLEGAANTIALYKPVLFVENNIPEKSAPLLQQIMDLGYVAHWHISPHYSKTNFFEENQNIFDQAPPSVNLLCVPSDHPGPRKQLVPVAGADETWQEAAKRA